MKLTPAQFRKQLRKLVSDVVTSSGCGCCQSQDYDNKLELLAKAINIPKYSDNSGYDFYKYRSK